jgi:hypothetical protein
MFTNPNPTCDKECKFSESHRMTTCAYYPPVYDKNGVNINPDSNVTSYEIMCNLCKKRWTASSQFGKTTYDEIN